MPATRKGWLRISSVSAHFHMLRLGKIIIHQAIIRSLERAAVQEVERDQRLERLEVDSVDDFQVLGGGELPDDRRHHLDVRQLRQHAADLDRHGSIADARHERSVGRLHDHISADAGLALPGIIQHAYREAHDQQDQRHLESNRHNADQRPDGPMHQVGDNHLVHHGSSSLATSCWLLHGLEGRCSLWAGGVHQT